MAKGSVVWMMVGVALLGTVGCAEEGDLASRPATTTTATAAPGGEADTAPGDNPSEEPESEASGTAELDPCSLLSAEGQAEMGFTEAGEARQVGSGRTCRWTRDEPDGNHFVFDVIIHDEGGIADLPPEVLPDTTSLPDVGSHPAVQVVNPANPGACTVMMEVTESSRVETQLIAGRDTQLGCDLAMQMATLVEPALP